MSTARIPPRPWYLEQSTDPADKRVWIYAANDYLVAVIEDHADLDDDDLGTLTIPALTVATLRVLVSRFVPVVK